MMLSVVIVNFRNPPLLRLALTSLARALGTPLQYEVIVVDSASTIETQNVVRHDCASLFERLILVPFSRNTGYTNGVNPDIVVLPGAIEGLMAYLRDHPTVGLAGPGLLNFDDTRQDSCFRFYSPLVMLARRISIPFTRRLIERFLMHEQVLTQPTTADWLMGSALMTTRSALDQVGFMDEQFFLYLSEVDWAHRFWEHGYTVAYVPTVRMYHYHQRQSKGRLGIIDAVLRQQTRWHIRDAFRYFRKHGLKGERPANPQPLQPGLLTA
jgi:N-acetylglucosaminyl-diphospho-decaprenol L-rhamnosyltransferase